MNYNIGHLKYIDALQLCQWIKHGYQNNLGQKIQIIDVRGQDHIGGHIKGSWNIGSRQFPNEMETLKQRLIKDNIETVIFHCAHSQQRGPSAALKFLRYTDNAFDIRVLMGGFYEWQQHYGKDETLTEGYITDLWE